MTEDRVERLLERYADQLSAGEWQTAVPAEVRERLRAYALEQGSRQRWVVRLWPYWAGAGAVAVAASLALFFVPLGAPIRIDAMSIAPVVLRGAEEQIDVALKLSRTGFIRIVVIDDRCERWVLPFDEKQSTFVQRLDGAKTLHITSHPNPAHPDSKTRYILAIASRGERPTAAELLQVIPDPVVSPDAGETALRKAIDQLRERLEKRFDCTVRFERLPAF